MSTSRLELWEDFIVFLETPAHLRGTTRSEAEWARKHDMSPRTLRRWKENEEFKKLQEKYRLRIQLRQPDPTPAEPVGEDDQASYQIVKAKLIEGAASGNPKYLDLYFKTYGKPYVEEETAARTSDLAGQELDQLVAHALTQLDPHTLETQLTQAGWGVVRPTMNNYKEGDDGVDG